MRHSRALVRPSMGFMKAFKGFTKAPKVLMKDSRVWRASLLPSKAQSTYQKMRMICPGRPLPGPRPPQPGP
jgi:hypothetical protein